MPVLASPEVFAPYVDDLQLYRQRLQGVQNGIAEHAARLDWEGGGVDRFHTQLDHADKGFDHCTQAYAQAVTLLDQAMTELTRARSALARAEQFVMDEAVKAKDPAQFFHHLGWVQYPVLPAPYATEWEDLAIRAGYHP